MKKIALILSLIMVMTLALVACGDKPEESKPAESVENSVEESKPAESAETPAESSEEEAQSEDESEPETESSEEAQSEDESEPETESSEDVPPTPVSGTNIAKDKSYTVSGSGHGKRAGGEWPCNYDAKLTDGVTCEEVAYSNAIDDPNPAWFSISADTGTIDGANAPDGVCTIVIDLGESKAITGSRIHMITPNTAGIGSPTEIEVSVSSDNANFKRVGVATDFADSDTAYWTEFGFTDNARYVQYKISITAAHNFIDEIEVLG